MWNSRIACYLILVWLSHCALRHADAQTGTLADPISPPSPNAALCYQRALLYLSAINQAERSRLDSPVWQTLPEFEDKESLDDVKRLLYLGRMATRSAANGARLNHCDFGIDFRTHGASTPLPHVKAMRQLGRLVALRGFYEQSNGNWEEAAVIYFDGLRMGSHMTHQNTLAEALAGLDILRSNSYGLCLWASECPNAKMVSRAFRLFESSIADFSDAPGSFARESSILRQRLIGLRETFPDGPWAELVLEDFGQPIPQDQATARKKAKQLCVERGVPADVFETENAFHRHLSKIADLNTQFTEAAAHCMTLPPLVRIERGQKLFDTYARLSSALGDELAINPAEVGKAFAIYEAELTVVRVALALAASRGEKGFPESLEAVSAGFGGKIPVSPYDGSPLEYRRLDDGKEFALRVTGVYSKGVSLPEIELSSEPPTIAQK